LVTFKVFNVHLIFGLCLPLTTSSKILNNFSFICARGSLKNVLEIWWALVEPLQRYRTFTVPKFVGYIKKKKKNKKKWEKESNGLL